MRPSLLLIAALVLFSVGCSAPAGQDSPAEAPTLETAAFGADEIPHNTAWALDPLWDDGKAEVGLYDATRPQYGRIESYQAVFIVVKEDFHGRLFVKADPPYENKDIFPVLKLNAVHSYQTPNYPYHFLESIFVYRDDPTHLAKLTLGSQEWCGNTFKEITTWTPRPELHIHSYFDGQGDTFYPLDLGRGDLLEDQLPLALRGLAFEPGLEVKFRLLPSLIGNSQRRAPQFVPASLHVAGEDAVETGLGRLTAWKADLRFGELEQSWWFEKASPHTLLQMESSDGRSWVLRERTRKPYWQEATFVPEP